MIQMNAEKEQRKNLNKNGIFFSFLLCKLLIALINGVAPEAAHSPLAGGLFADSSNEKCKIVSIYKRFNGKTGKRRVLYIIKMEDR